MRAYARSDGGGVTTRVRPIGLAAVFAQRLAEGDAARLKKTRPEHGALNLTSVDGRALYQAPAIVAEEVP
jgi:hypothetical protein